MALGGNLPEGGEGFSPRPQRGDLMLTPLWGRGNNPPEGGEGFNTLASDQTV